MSADLVAQITQATRWILEAMEIHRGILLDIHTALLTATWTCGCGHMNGANLAVCAQCGRRPGEVC